MTRRKRLKRLVRERMRKTGERYAAARRHIIGQVLQTEERGPDRRHFPGSIPATTALRVVLSAADVRDPATGKPFSEAMLFGIAGGIGAGMFAFYYDQDDFSSIFLAGRHLWDDDAAYLQAAFERFGVTPTVTETGGRKRADKNLRTALESDLPVIAWVDSAGLPHRAMPESWSGGGYHVVSVYGIDDRTGEVLIGDLADEPNAVSSDVFADARARIKKFKNRVLSIEQQPVDFDLETVVRSGLQRCHDAMKTARLKNFTLATFKTWADRIHGGKGKESWDRIFPRGVRLWRGLTSVYDFIEHYGTGGGLMRPLFADSLAEAADALQDARLRDLSERYAELGHLWSELADAALPDDVSDLARAKQLLAEKAAAMFSGGDDTAETITRIWPQLEELRLRAREEFPLSDAECDALRADLQRRILEIHEKEAAALELIGAAAQSA